MSNNSTWKHLNQKRNLTFSQLQKGSDHVDLAKHFLDFLKDYKYLQYNNNNFFKMFSHLIFYMIHKYISNRYILTDVQ